MDETFVSSSPGSPWVGIVLSHFCCHYGQTADRKQLQEICACSWRGQCITAAEEWVQACEVACSRAGKPGCIEKGFFPFSFYLAQNFTLRDGAVHIEGVFPPQLNLSRNISMDTPNTLPW